MQYGQRKLQVSMTDIRKSCKGRANASNAGEADSGARQALMDEYGMSASPRRCIDVRSIGLDVQAINALA